MIVDVPKIPPDGEQVTGEDPPEVLDAGEDLVPESGLAYDLRLQVVSQELVVRGAVRMALRAACSRCADFFSTTVDVSTFLRAYALREGQVTVDITPDLREAILLQVPNHPLCRPACAGLCPRCGKNLNGGRCGCPPPPAAGYWTPLEGLGQ